MQRNGIYVQVGSVRGSFVLQSKKFSSDNQLLSESSFSAGIPLALA